MQQTREQYSGGSCRGCRCSGGWRPPSGALAVLADDLAAGRPGGVVHALELEAGDHVVEAPVAVPGFLAGVEELEAGRDDDGADLDLDDARPVCSKSIAPGLADLVARLLALLPLKRAGSSPVDGRRAAARPAGTGCRSRGACRAPGRTRCGTLRTTQASGADAAAGARVRVDVARLLAHLHLEVADEAVDLVDLAVGQQLDVGVLADGRPSSA